MRPATQLSPGSKVGAWRVESEARPRREGVSYAVTNLSSWDVAMLDVYNAPPLAFGTYTERLRSVLNGIKRIEHPAVLKLFDVGMLPDGRPYVVREMLSGTALGDLMPSQRPALGESLQILRCICDALIAAHDAGVVHRAVALDNVLLVGETKAVKLIDWGISEVIADEAARRSKLGTLDVVNRPVLSKKHDVYAFGVLMHQLLGEIPSVLGELWSAMMARDPSQRPTMHEVAQQLTTKRDRKPTTPPVVASPLAARVSAEQPVPVAPVSGSMATASPPGGIFRRAATAMGCAAVPLMFWLVGSKLQIESPPSAEAVEIAPVSAAETVEVAVAPDPAAPDPVAPDPVAPAPDPIVAPAPGIAVAPEPAPVRTAARVAPIQTREPRPTAKPRAQPMQLDYTLMNDYQRVGRALLLLERELGPEATAPLKKQFKRIRIDAAMANVHTRQRAAVKLTKLHDEIERYRSK